MFGLFTSRIMTDDGIAQLRGYLDYLHRNGLVINPGIVWPTTETFAAFLAGSRADGPEYGYFRQVVAHYGLHGVAFELAPHASTRVLDFKGLAGERHSDDPGGTYSRDEGGRPLITFDPTLLERPVDLVAVLSHEVCHYLIHERLKEGHPADIDDEVLTDVMSIANGYGVFALRSCFREENWSSGNMSGWSIKRSGYLSINETAYLLASATSADPTGVERVKNHLDGMHLRKYRNALKQIRTAER